MESNTNYDNIMYSIQIAVILMGLTGNLVSFLVFSRPTFAKNSISTYCRALAIFESFTIVELFTNFYLILYNYFIGMYSNSLCKAFYYVLIGFASIPGWILIAFSFDKLLSLRKAKTVMKKRFVQYSIITGIVLCNLLLYIEIPIFLELTPVQFYGVTILMCDTSTLAFSQALRVMFMVESSILPFIIMLALSIATIRLIRNSRRTVNTSRACRKNRDLKFAVTSLVFNFLFIFLKLPMVVIYLVGLDQFDDYFFQVAILLYFVNYSISFFVHFVSNSLYRRELFVLIGLRRARRQSIGTSLQSTHATKNF